MCQLRPVLPCAVTNILSAHVEKGLTHGSEPDTQMTKHAIETHRQGDRQAETSSDPAAVKSAVIMNLCKTMTNKQKGRQHGRVSMQGD